MPRASPPAAPPDTAPPAGSPAQNGAAMLPPLARLLRPLVRLLIRGGITFPVLSELLRGLYVEVAVAELPAPARTDSRLSLMTGVHRKEIRRLRLLPQRTHPVPALVTLNSQLIARWLGGADTADADGRPRPLPRAESGDAPSFERLVRGATTDVRPRSVLDDWLAQGIATVDEADLVHLAETAFVPRPGRDGQLFYFGRNLHDHIAAAAANVGAASGGQEPGAAPFLERSVHYDRLGAAVARRLVADGGAAANRLLLDVNRLALALLDEAGEPAPGEPTCRVNVGLYIYHEPEAAAGSQPAAPAGADGGA